MKLDVNALRYLSKEEFRVLTAVEMGMRNVFPLFLFLLTLYHPCLASPFYVCCFFFPL
jgi:Rio2, N-terminal